MNVTLTLAPHDFHDLTTGSLGYSEEGLTGRLKKTIGAALRNQIENELGHVLIKTVVALLVAPNLFVRKILEKDEFSLRLLDNL